MKIYLVTSNPTLTSGIRAELERIGKLTVFDGHKLSEKEVVEKAADAEILIAGSSGIDKISRKVLLGLPKLKMIATLTVGVSWIDIAAAKELKILVSNTKGANSESVAEHAWGMILDLTKRITEFNQDLKNKGTYDFSDYLGKEVFGKTIGIIGLGDVGSKIARISEGFNMRVLAFDPGKKNYMGIKFVDLETLLKESDVIVTTVPLTEETKDMISDHEISLMKDGVILINPAMEAITDKSAVLKAVNSGKIFGFGLETEIMKPIPADDPYLNHPRILVTPHNAFNTEEANLKTYMMAWMNIKSYISGEPNNIVNP